MLEKTFYKILVDFTSSIEKTKRSIRDLRLTKTEKLIIEGHLDIRKNLNQKVLKDFSNISPSESPFIESQRLLLIGCALNNLGQFVEAEKSIQGSLGMLKSIDAPYFTFYSSLLLFTIYHNLNQAQLMMKTIQAMESHVQTPRQKAQLLVCRFCYEQEVGDIQKARRWLHEVDAVMGDLTEGDTVRQLVNKFCFLVQIEELTQARTVLNELKKFRNYQLSENYNFMKKLLDHLTEGDPLYVYGSQFQDVPVLLHQLKVIQYLEGKNIDLAQAHWEKLKLISPSTYGQDFSYQAVTCLFSLALKKNLESSVAPVPISRSSGHSKIDQLHELFMKTQGPIHGSLIFELIWGSFPEDKEDLKKVSRLISRLKCEKEISISFRKGHYTLIRHKKSKSG